MERTIEGKVRKRKRWEGGRKREIKERRLEKKEYMHVTLQQLQLVRMH